MAAGEDRGYEAESTPVRLEFGPDTRYGEDVSTGRPALTVLLETEVSMQVLLRMQRFGPENEDNEDILIQFGDEVLLDWNYEKRGLAIEATGDGFVKAAPHLCAFLMNKWLEIQTAVDVPLAAPSTSGEQSETQNAPTALWSRNL